jgi:hypothetical protein
VKKKSVKLPDLNQTLTELEGSDWAEPTFDSHLISTCHSLRRKPLKYFSVEDLRMMIGQNLSLAILVPIALDLLQEDPLTEGDYFPGDLLLNLMRIDRAFLLDHPSLSTQILDLYQRVRNSLIEDSFAKRDFIKAEEYLKSLISE